MNEGEEMQSPPRLQPPTSGTASKIETLTSKREKRYLGIVATISCFVWVVLTISMVGLVYAALIGLFLYFASGLFAASLRSEAVEISEQQMPELMQTFRDACTKLGMKKLPRLYVLEASGALNAFAMRHSGRDFVVLYADMLEAFGPSSDETKFIIGHELGHIRRHLGLKAFFLAPGILTPLLGSAYSRACETTCDRYGAFVSEDSNASQRAMLVLSGGKKYGKQFDARRFADQHVDERGFFISLHELTSGYPTLSRRVSDLIALRDDREPTRARRHPFAYFFGLFLFGGRGNSGASFLVTIFIVAILSSMLLPALSKAKAKAVEIKCLNGMQTMRAAYDAYVANTGELPENFDNFIGPGKMLIEAPLCPVDGEYSTYIADDNSLAIECTVHGDLDNLLISSSPASAISN
jgi:Zn-dependent protease with chaperone function